MSFGLIRLSRPRAGSIAFGLLIAIITLTPALALEAGWLETQLVSLITAVMLALLVNAPAFDLQRSMAILKPLGPAASLPAAWMLLQIIPLPLGSFGHPIWRSAALALAEKPFGHISIDLGFTLRALFEYFALAALVFATCVLGRNRDRAQQILFALSTVAAVVVVALMTLPSQPAALLGFPDHLVALASLGVILNAASTIRTIERRQTRADRHASYFGMLLWNAASALMCLLALLRFASRGILIAAGSGWVVFMLVLLIKRLNLRRGIAASMVAAVVMFGGIMTLQITAIPGSSLLQALVPTEFANEGATTLMMLSDAIWAGSGVGSYRALAAIYRDASESPGATPVNTMAAAILEWGYVGVLIVAAPLLQQLIVLFRGAVSRGRDWFYAAAGAGCLVTLLCETACDASLTESTVRTFAAVIVGLGLSQTVGTRPR